MVYVFYTLNTIPFTKDRWDRYLSEIPDLFRQKILKLIRWEDRQNSLTGKLLLKYGLENLYNLPKSINLVQVSPFGKLFIPNGPTFNISHSDFCTICVFNSLKEQSCILSDIGVDIEKVKPIEVRDFFNVFTIEEQAMITDSKSPLCTFYEIWTRKEAVLKAQGSGLTNSLNKFCVSQNQADINGSLWYTHPIEVCKGYICHIATKERSPKISIQSMTF
ncbi:MAG: 4'-phosphopantetheinyl transferase superfamily protein [Desulfamplus sp.]|nr:4'-phosphopantetheinyl transferase superfamily protein [Desulfamplus sp.]